MLDHPYSFSNAIALAKSTGMTMKSKNPDLSKLKFTPSGDLLAFNLNRNVWTTLPSIPTAFFNDPALHWFLCEERPLEVIHATACLGIDFTANGELYNATIALVCEDRIKNPEFYTNRKVKITIEVIDDVV